MPRSTAIATIGYSLISPTDVVYCVQVTVDNDPPQTNVYDFPSRNPVPEALIRAATFALNCTGLPTVLVMAKDLLPLYEQHISTLPQEHIIKEGISSGRVTVQSPNAGTSRRLAEAETIAVERAAHIRSTRACAEARRIEEEQLVREELAREAREAQEREERRRRELRSYEKAAENEAQKRVEEEQKAREASEKAARLRAIKARMRSGQ